MHLRDANDVIEVSLWQITRPKQSWYRNEMNKVRSKECPFMPPSLSGSRYCSKLLI